MREEPRVSLADEKIDIKILKNLTTINNLFLCKQRFLHGQNTINNKMVKKQSAARMAQAISSKRIHRVAIPKQFCQPF